MKFKSKNICIFRKHALFAAAILVFSASGLHYAQTRPLASVSGVVLDRKTNKPLYYANVFLASTTLGAATDQDGNFKIEKIPLGSHQLVISMIGHERIVRDIRITEPIDYTFRFSLQPKVIEAPGLTVSARYPHRWKKQLKVFTAYFLGESENAGHCTILNPEILDFKEEESTKFTASAHEPLKIINSALGYELSFHLRRFEIIDNAYLIITGETHFSELETENLDDIKRWRKNRVVAYQGSMRHFFKSLIVDQLKEEGFTVHALTGLPLNGNVVGMKHLPEDSLVHATSSLFEKTLTLPPYLQILYQHEKEPESYKRKAGKQWINRRGNFQTVTNRRRGQVSYLEVNYNYILINHLGHLYDPHAVTVYGFWGWEQRIADMLPLNYDPYYQKLTGNQP
jgi:hypothetical protein